MSHSLPAFVKKVVKSTTSAPKKNQQVIISFLPSDLPKTELEDSDELLVSAEELLETKNIANQSSCAISSNDPIFLKGLLENYLGKSFAERRAFEALSIQLIEIDQRILELQTQIEQVNVDLSNAEHTLLQTQDLLNTKVSLLKLSASKTEEARNILVANREPIVSSNWINGISANWTFNGNKDKGLGWLGRWPTAKDNAQAAAISRIHEIEIRDLIQVAQLESTMLAGQFSHASIEVSLKSKELEIKRQMEFLEHTKRASLEAVKNMEIDKRSIANNRLRLRNMVARYFFNFFMSHYLCIKLMRLLATQLSPVGQHLFADYIDFLEHQIDEYDNDNTLQCSQNISAFIDGISSLSQSFSIEGLVSESQVDIDVKIPDSTVLWLKGVHFLQSDQNPEDYSLVLYTPPSSSIVIYGSPLKQFDTTAQTKPIPSELVNLNPMGKWKIESSYKNLVMRLDLVSVDLNKVPLFENIYSLPKNGV